MGTNYYWHEKDACDKCCRDFPAVHIGKSSGGWCFALHVYPGEINTLDDWRAKWATGYILNEYGEKIAPEDLLCTVTNRKGEPAKTVPPGYASWDDFLKRNSAIRGPHNLMRHVILENHCIGHGDGTWDYIIGEFS